MTMRYIVIEIRNQKSNKEQNVKYWKQTDRK